MELDHVFVVVTPGAAREIEALRSAGLTVLREPNRHEGQGTASVSAYFGNGYLELIWVDTTIAVDADHTATAAWFRAATEWRTNGRSPFGFGLHRQPGDTAALPVPVRREPAAWLRPGSAYELLHQPGDSLAADFFVVPQETAVPAWVARAREREPKLFRHPGGGDRITRVRAHGRPEHEPRAFRGLRPALLEMADGAEPLLEVQLDGGGRERIDLRPVLPIVIVR